MVRIGLRRLSSVVGYHAIDGQGYQPQIAQGIAQSVVRSLDGARRNRGFTALRRP